MIASVLLRLTCRRHAKPGHDEDVVLLPVEPAAGDLGGAAAFDDLIEGTGGFALEPGLFARSQQDRPIIQGRKDRAPVAGFTNRSGDPS